MSVLGVLNSKGQLEVLLFPWFPRVCLMVEGVVDVVCCVVGEGDRPVWGFAERRGRTNNESGGREREREEGEKRRERRGKKTLQEEEREEKALQVFESSSSYRLASLSQIKVNCSIQAR
jgi:hypothetical protein